MGVVKGDPLFKHDLAKAIAIEVQRWNANMIVDRSPRVQPLKTNNISEVAMAVSKWKKEASEKLKIISTGPAMMKPQNLKTYPK